MKLLVFQTPPEAPETYSVLPDGSDGSRAMPPMRPELPPEFSDAGPMAVQVVLVRPFAGSWVKMRKWGAKRSAMSSPRPLEGVALGRNSVQLLSVPVWVPWLVSASVQTPKLPLPSRTDRGCCGLNGPVGIGVLAFWIG